MIYLLDNTDPSIPFPPVDRAETEPDGLLAVGGDLNPIRLLQAYRQGIFPWYSDDQPILWWSPNPRTVLYPDQVKISKSLGKSLRNRPYRVTFDHAFTEVVEACGAPGTNRQETWISEEMIQAYTQLFLMGYAHAVEVWEEDRLIGGLYGLAIGNVFFGESMFCSQRDASKVALVHLAKRLTEWKFGLIDCQVNSPHLMSLGAEEISRDAFCQQLDKLCIQPGQPGSWKNSALL